MLAPPQRRQDLRQPHFSEPLSAPTSPQQLSLNQLSQQIYDQQLLNDYLKSQQTFADAAVSTNEVPDAFVAGACDLNPSIRIQQSTSAPQPATAYSQTPMLSTEAIAASVDSWNTFNTMSANNHSLQTPLQNRADRTQQCASSASSVGSAASPYHLVAPTAGYSVFPNIPNHLPTPTQTPTQDSFVGPDNFNNFTPTSTSMDSTMTAHMSMKQALMDQHVPEEEVPGFGHSGRHSVSSYGQDSPATPHTISGDDIDFKARPSESRTVPKFERTYTDVAADYSFDANSINQTQSIAQAKTTANTLLSPWRSSNPNDIVQRSLQAAQMARSQSPSTNSASRRDSPFRRGSPYRQPTDSLKCAREAVGTASVARDQKIDADAAHAMKPGVQAHDEVVKTISPKDALLDYREADDDSKVSLFAGSGSEYEHQYNGGDQYRSGTQSTFDTRSCQSYRRDSWATPQFSPNLSASSAGASQPSTFIFPTAPAQGNYTNIPNFAPTSQYRTTSNMPSGSDANPEFPAHLTSMESSASEAGLEPGSQSSERLVKPADSGADSGTYTCTYHGCIQRFESPQKLQKHKREGHRSTATTVGSGMTSAALLERNSQAGPHKCERINPTTGKPCNTIFSRPYDLTRHEDTIHNARKQKVRCALCVEEKTFSRNDALTRHMRVVHPEVDFPGKHRRRGGNHD